MYAEWSEEEIAKERERYEHDLAVVIGGLLCNYAGGWDELEERAIVEAKARLLTKFFELMEKTGF
jgi:hypothetical protein